MSTDSRDWMCEKVANIATGKGKAQVILSAIGHADVPGSRSLLLGPAGSRVLNRRAVIAVLHSHFRPIFVCP